MTTDSFCYLLSPLPDNIVQALEPLAGPLSEPGAIQSMQQWLPRFVATGRPLSSLREYVGDRHLPGTIEQVIKSYPLIKTAMIEGLKAGLSRCSLLEINSLSKGDKDLASANRLLKQMLKSEIEMLENEQSGNDKGKKEGSSWADSLEVKQRLSAQRAVSTAELVSRNLAELGTS